MKNMTDIIEKDAIAIMENVDHKAVIDKLLELLKNSKRINPGNISVSGIFPLHFQKARYNRDYDKSEGVFSQ